MVRRLCLAPGEAIPWHRDPFQRVAVVLGGDLLSIEYGDGGESQRVEITPGQVDWEEPSARVHRAAKVGKREPLLVVACRSVKRLHLLCLVINHGLFGELGIFAFLQQTIDAVCAEENHNVVHLVEVCPIGIAAVYGACRLSAVSGAASEAIP
jgi:hypothetical protein